MDDRCIVNFFNRENQRHYRFLAQSQSHSFQKELEIYKNIFIANYNCSKAYYSQCSEKCENKTICRQLSEGLMSIEEEKIISFFDNIIKAYELWVDAEWSKALDVFSDLLKSYQLLDSVYVSAAYDVCFRGRKNTSVLESKDMFHIPFDKRYLIENQRFSISGQPLLYLGLSVKNVLVELDINDDENLDDLKLSYVLFNEKLRLYNLKVDNELMSDSLLNIMSRQTVDYEKLFFNGILASICSFEKLQEFKRYNFHEEYVVPQLLAQSLKAEGFDGIRYETTKLWDENNSNMKCFSDNIALFTHKTGDIYDEGLWDNLNISTPITYNRMIKLGLADLNRVLNKIKELDKDENCETYEKAKKIHDIFIAESTRTTIKGMPYLETNAGIAHNNLIYIVLNAFLHNMVGGKHDSKKNTD